MRASANRQPAVIINPQSIIQSAINHPIRSQSSNLQSIINLQSSIINHSARGAVVGSTLVARHAGI